MNGKDAKLSNQKGFEDRQTGISYIFFKANKKFSSHCIFIQV